MERFNCKIKMIQNNRKSQITIFLILGVFLVIIVTTLVLITRYVAKKTTSGEVIDASQTTLDIQPIKNYIEQCISIVSKDGLVKLGKQGGYLFESQGGTVIDYSDYYNGRVFVKYGDFKVIYNILKPRFEVGDYFPSDPDSNLGYDPYPWKYFPHYPQLDSGPTYFGKDAFGTNMMPTLMKSSGRHSIQEQLETFVDNNINDDCLDFSVFEEQGFRITEKDGSREITLNINENDIVFTMNYPLIVESLVSEEKTEIKDFLVKQDFRLKQLHSFINGLIENDISNVKFDIESGSGGFSVEKIQNVNNNPNNDDLIIITDERSLIDAVPYQYYFMRKNRNPALEYIIEMNNLGDSRCVYTKEDKKVDCTFKSGIRVTTCCSGCRCNPYWEPRSYTIKKNYFPEKAHDPDEDEWSISYEGIPPPIGGGVCKKVTEKITQIVSDGKLEDWQVVTFYVHWDTENICNCPCSHCDNSCSACGTCED